MGETETILVTGATGFVGRYLVDHLVRSGENVIATGRRFKYEKYFKDLDVPFVQLDVTDPDNFSRLDGHSIKAFIHLAAVIPAAVRNIHTDQYIKTNTLGTFYALEYCRKNSIKKFLFTTTRFEVSGHSKLPINESMGRSYSLSGDHAPYVISKVFASDYVEHYYRNYGIQGIVLRLTGLLGYGRYEGVWIDDCYYPSAFEILYRQAKRFRPLEVWGEHKVKRDSLYVKDALRPIYMAISSDSARGLYSIGSGAGRTNEQDIRDFSEVFGSENRPVPIIYRPDLKENNMSYYFDISKAFKDFGWAPRYSYKSILVDYDREAIKDEFLREHV